MTRDMSGYFFVSGSGVFLWFGNDSALEKFGCPVQVQDLGPPEKCRPFHSVARRVAGLWLSLRFIAAA